MRECSGLKKLAANFCSDVETSAQADCLQKQPVLLCVMRCLPLPVSNAKAASISQHGEKCQCTFKRRLSAHSALFECDTIDMRREQGKKAQNIQTGQSLSWLSADFPQHLNLCSHLNAKMDVVRNKLRITFDRPFETWISPSSIELASLR